MAMQQASTLDLTFRALADGTRRSMIRALAGGNSRSAGELGRQFRSAQPTISRHLKVLEEAELISNERHGKHRRCRLKPEALTAAADWLDFHRRFWSGSFDRLAAHLKQPGENQP